MSFLESADVMQIFRAGGTLQLPCFGPTPAVMGRPLKRLMRMPLASAWRVPHSS